MWLASSNISWVLVRSILTESAPGLRVGGLLSLVLNFLTFLYTCLSPFCSSKVTLGTQPYFEDYRVSPSWNKLPDAPCQQVSFLKVYLYFMCVCARVRVPLEVSTGCLSDSLKREVHRVLSHMDSGNWISVLSKSCKHSQPVGYLF